MAQSEKSSHAQRVRDQVQLEARSRDHRLQVGLVLTGVLLLAVFLWTGLKENVYTDWRRYQLEYRDILEKKAKTKLGRKLHQDFDIRIRQVVIPELGVVDRCVSCHNGITDPRMTDVKSPHKVHPGPYLNQHEVGKFGCTICHRGQGRALVFSEAKAVGHHWPHPMLPGGLTQSSCGLCHSPAEVRSAGGEKYARGHRLFGELGCVSCHKLYGRGGSLGPELTREGWKAPQEVSMKNVRGDKTLARWIYEHFQDPQRIVPGSLMPPPRLAAGQLEALTIYTLSLQRRDLPSKYLSPGKYLELHRLRNPPEMTGKQLVARYCGTCHDTGSYGRYDAFYQRFIPAIRGPSFVQLVTPEYLDAAIRRGRPGTPMAAWAGGLKDNELVKIRSYLLGRKVEPGVRLPPKIVAQAKDPGLVIHGDVAQGAAIFARQCASCHGPRGEGRLGPALANRVFQGSATDGFLYATIAYGRADTAMPAFLGTHQGSYRPSQIQALVAFVRSLGGGVRPRAKVASGSANRRTP